MLSVRTVNYFIDEETGEYKFGSKIVSTTFLWLGGGGDAAVLTTPDTAAHDNDACNVYVGVEDVRLFRASDNVLYMSGTRGMRVVDAADADTFRFNLCVEFGPVVEDGGDVVVANTRLLSWAGRQTTLEKNWALLEDLTAASPSLKFVYAWSPEIVIGDVTDGAEVTETHCTPSPPSLKGVRGSTNGVLTAGNTEWWFICHRMEHRDGRRQYTHVFVVLDATSPELRFKRHSAFFTFEGGGVEYTLGFVVLGDDLLVGYSVMDRETKFVRVSRESLDATLFRQHDVAAAAATTTFCVNMIVRQEGQIMCRCLNALAGVASEFAILDTGSTDDTVAQIEAFDAFPGRVATSTFRDFAQARNEALALAAAASSSLSSSHLLLLDADMVFVVGAGGRSALSAFVSAAEPDAVFLVLQCHGGLEYYNARIVPLRRVRAGDIRYVGVTHEYLHDASGRGAVRVPRDIAFIQDVSDGGCKHDKTERDIRLLTRALNDDDLSTGDRARYTFYLAQSYRDSGSGGKARAQEYYRARAAMPHTWVEEVAYSLLQLVRMALEDKDEAGALELLAKLAATGVRRPEAFCAMTGYYRETGRHADAMRYLMLTYQNMPATRGCDDDSLPLFFDTSVAYVVQFEASIVLWYTNDQWWRRRGRELCVELLARENPALPAPMRAVLQGNFDNFYKTVD